MARLSGNMSNPIKYRPVKSSLLAGYSYDSQTQVLSVQFKDGSEKDYKDIDPPTMSKIFDSPGSVGSKFLKATRGRKS